MSNTYIEKIESSEEKARIYSYQMERYKLAIQHEFYFEAIVISYAMIEDRLLAFLHYAGVIDRRKCTQNNQNEQKIHVSEQAKKQINILLNNQTNYTIRLDTINYKIRIINALMKLPEENNDLYLNLVRAQIDRTINREKFMTLLQDLNTWLKPRNQIIHALMNKRTKAVLERQLDIAESGYKLGRALDGFVAKLKTGNKNGIRIAETKE